VEGKRREGKCQCNRTFYPARQRKALSVLEGGTRTSLRVRKEAEEKRRKTSYSLHLISLSLESSRSSTSSPSPQASQSPVPQAASPPSRPTPLKDGFGLS
jgi:hypothetical protein